MKHEEAALAFQWHLRPYFAPQIPNEVVESITVAFLLRLEMNSNILRYRYIERWQVSNVVIALKNHAALRLWRAATKEVTIRYRMNHQVTNVLAVLMKARLPRR